MTSRWEASSPSGKFRTIILGDLTLNRQFELMSDRSPRLGGSGSSGPSRKPQCGSARIRPAPTSGDHEQRHSQRSTAGSNEGAFRFPGSHRCLADALFVAKRPGIHRTGNVRLPNLFDEPQVAMPVAPAAAPSQGQPAPSAPPHNGTAYYFKVSAQPDGTFTVTNTRNGFAKTYKASRAD